MAIISQRCCYIVTKNHSYSSKPSCELTAHWIKPLTLQPSKYDCSSIGHNWCLAMINQPNLIKSVTPDLSSLNDGGNSLHNASMKKSSIINLFQMKFRNDWQEPVSPQEVHRSVGPRLRPRSNEMWIKMERTRKFYFWGQKDSRELLLTFFLSCLRFVHS